MSQSTSDKTSRIHGRVKPVQADSLSPGKAMPPIAKGFHPVSLTSAERPVTYSATRSYWITLYERDAP
jgi:hypothetical protein